MAKRTGKTPTVSRESVLSTTPKQSEHELSIAALMETRPEIYSKVVEFLEQGMSPGVRRGFDPSPARPGEKDQKSFRGGSNSRGHPLNRSKSRRSRPTNERKIVR